MSTNAVLSNRLTKAGPTSCITVETATVQESAQMSDKRKAIHARLEDPLIERVDNWRRQQPVIPPRWQAVRELIEEALREVGKAKPETS